MQLNIDIAAKSFSVAFLVICDNRRSSDIMFKISVLDMENAFESKMERMGVHDPLSDLLVHFRH